MMTGSFQDRLKAFMARHMIAALFLFTILVLALVFSMKPLIGGFMVLVMVLLSVFALRLDLGLYAIIFSLHFDSLTRLSLESTLTLKKLLIVLVLALLVLRTVVSKDREGLKNLNANPLTLTIYVFFTFSIVSLINARDFLMYFGQNLRRFNLVVFYLLLITLIRDPRILKKLLIVFLAGSVIAACMGVYEMATAVNVLELRWGEEAIEKAAFGTLTRRVKLKEAVGEARFERREAFRVLGLRGNPDFHAHSMIMPSMLLLLFIALTKSWTIRIIGFSLFVLFLVNILASGARGGLIALGLGLTVFLIFHKMRYKFLIASMAAFAVFILLFVFFTVAPQSAYERLSFAAETKTIAYRIGLSEMAISMISDHPFLGVGTGNFIAEYNRYIVPSVPRTPLWTHNCFLQMWAENGIFGFLSYLGLYFFAAGNVLLVWRKSSDPFLRGASATILAILVSYFFYAGIDPLIEDELHWIAFALSTALFNIFQRQRLKGAAS